MQSTFRILYFMTLCRARSTAEMQTSLCSEVFINDIRCTVNTQTYLGGSLKSHSPDYSCCSRTMIVHIQQHHNQFPEDYSSELTNQAYSLDLVLKSMFVFKHYGQTSVMSYEAQRNTRCIKQEFRAIPYNEW